MRFEKILLNARRTGRTTRMLQEAIYLAREGRAVYIATANPSQATQLCNQLHDMLPTHEREGLLGIKIEPYYMLNNIDWDRMTLRGAWPNVKLLVDHHVLETRFANVLEMLHRYDL